MTPIELYEFLRSQYSDLEVDSICQIEKTCKRTEFCKNKQSRPVLDFDEIKENYYNKIGVDKKPASVDAVCVGDSQKYFCFVELKGWRIYISKLDKQKRSVSETAEGYNLSGKLKDSQTLCTALTSDKDLFANMPVVFLLVTDIDVNKEGLKISTTILMLSHQHQQSSILNASLNPAKHSIQKSTSSMIIYVARILMSI